MTIAILWPPLEGEQNIADWKARLGWFFSPFFTDIIILTKDNVIENNIINHIGISSFNHQSKVTVVKHGTFNNFKDDAVYLIWNKNCEAPSGVNLSKISGSQTVDNITQEKHSPTKYYFIGNKNISEDAYLMTCFSYWYLGGENKSLLSRSQKEIVNLKKAAAKIGRTGLFGTGPSLNEAYKLNFDNSFNIICNTIVKNKNLLKKIKPKIIVASDAHFHFSYHRYSHALLDDIIWCLHMYDCKLLTFDKFAAFLIQKIPEIADKIIAIPAKNKPYEPDLEKDFSVTPADSVVNMFMLPVATFFETEINMYGFTGRSPDDNYFWAHSDDNQYQYFLPDVRTAHPGFFTDRNYEEYMSRVDRQMEERIQFARERSITIVAKTTSFYKSLSTNL